MAKSAGLPTTSTTWITGEPNPAANVADTSGSLTYKATYDSFGKVLSESGAGGDRFKYTGREAGAALYDYRARAYDPATGRFLQRDPIGFAGGDANLHRYVGNGPTNFVDPSGLAGEQGFLGRAGGALYSLKGSFDELVQAYRSGKIDPRTLDLGLDIIQMGLDVVGIFEPTPFADALSGAISLFRGDFLGAGISLFGFLPGIGDAAKLGKLGRYAQTLAQAVELAAKSEQAARIFGPALRALERILAIAEDIPIDKLPAALQDSARESLEQIRGLRRQLDGYADRTRTGKAPAAAPAADPGPPSRQREVQEGPAAVEGPKAGSPTASPSPAATPSSPASVTAGSIRLGVTRRPLCRISLV